MRSGRPSFPRPGSAAAPTGWPIGIMVGVAASSACARASCPSNNATTGAIAKPSWGRPCCPPSCAMRGATATSACARACCPEAGVPSSMLAVVKLRPRGDDSSTCVSLLLTDGCSSHRSPAMMAGGVLTLSGDMSAASEYAGGSQA